MFCCIFCKLYPIYTLFKHDNIDAMQHSKSIMFESIFMFSKETKLDLYVLRAYISS